MKMDIEFASWHDFCTPFLFFFFCLLYGKGKEETEAQETSFLRTCLFFCLSPSSASRPLGTLLRQKINKTGTTRLVRLVPPPAHNGI